MGMVDTVVNGLVKQGNKALGKGLIAAANAKNRENLQGQVISKVQEILVQITKQGDYIAQSEANITLLKAKLAAIEAGEFCVSTYGNVITFTDPELNKGVVSMLECTNCGYSARNRDIDSP